MQSHITTAARQSGSGITTNTNKANFHWFAASSRSRREVREFLILVDTAARICRMHADTALVYRRRKIYHTMRDLTGGRCNATYLDHWLAWHFSGRDADQCGQGQFDLRDLPCAGSDYQPARTPDYVSPLLSADDARNLMAVIDAEFGKPAGSRAWD